MCSVIKKVQTDRSSKGNREKEKRWEPDKKKGRSGERGRWLRMSAENILNSTKVSTRVLSRWGILEREYILQLIRLCGDWGCGDSSFDPSESVNSSRSPVQSNPGIVREDASDCWSLPVSSGWQFQRLC